MIKISLSRGVREHQETSKSLIQRTSKSVDKSFSFLYNTQLKKSPETGYGETI